MVNLINVSYMTIILLPYLDKKFANYRVKSM